MSQEACIRDFVRYEKKTGERSSLILQGARVEKDGKKYVRTENGDVVEVEPGFRKVNVKRDGWLVQQFCPPPLDTARLKRAGALELAAWKARSRKYWLTIGDLLRAKGEPLKVLVMDRNLGDVARDEATNERGKAYAPTTFFRRNVATFRGKLDAKSDALKGQMKWYDQRRAFEFEVEYKPGLWYPFEDGYLPAADPQKIFGRLLGSKKHWSAFPKGTRIGFRGPMVLWSDLAKMPKVYWA